MLCARRDLVILSARGCRHEGVWASAASGVGLGFEGAGLGPEGKVSKIWGLYRAQGEASRIWGRRPRAGVQLRVCSSDVREQWFRVQGLGLRV